MFKKIEIWILYLSILFGIIFSIGFSIFVGVLVRQELVGSTKVGWLSKNGTYFCRDTNEFKKGI